MSEYQPTLHMDGKKWNAMSVCRHFVHLHFYIVVEHSNEPTDRVLHPGIRWRLKACAIKQVTLFPALNTLSNSQQLLMPPPPKKKNNQKHHHHHHCVK
jgi:hypothetical protein